ncbi:MAG: L-lactate dehydrogenase, partial [Staphylococcus sp.]|nr:L-lactate dehydrogenase [Staphylococcus sp.]
ALLRISKALLNNENSILTVSSQLNGQYGFNDVYLGLPTLINQNGAVKIYETPLNDNELQLLEKSVKTLEDTYDSIKHLV